MIDLPVSRPTNRFLVRQRDRRWLHVLTSVLGLAGLLVAVLFLVGWPRLQSTSLHYDLIRLRAEVRELERQERSLALELEEVRSPLLLAEKARELGLQPAPPPESLGGGGAR